MSLAENLLNSLSETDYENSRIGGSVNEEQHIVIDENRRVTVPDNLQTIAVMGDKDIETVVIDCVRYWDGHDLSTFAIYINYILPNGDEGTYIPQDIDKLDDVFSFSWVIGKEITYNSGQLVFWIVAKLTDDNGDLIYQWSSFQNFDCSIATGGDKIYVPEKQIDRDVISQAISVSRQSAEIAQSAATSANDKAARADEAAERAEAAAERAEAAGGGGGSGGSGITVDKTLTILGAAADAKIAGDFIRTLNDEKIGYTDIINNLTTNLDNKALSAAQGVELKRLIEEVRTAIATAINAHNYDGNAHAGLREVVDDLDTEVRDLKTKVAALENAKPDMSGYVTTEQFETALGAYITDIDTLVGGGIEGGEPTPALISFTIGNKEYQAEEGMTWGDWVNSEYNTNGWTDDGEYVYNSFGAGITFVSTDGTLSGRVTPNETIISGTDYLTRDVE